VRLLPQASEESKVAVWWAAKPMVKAFGLAGAGAGGFGTAFTQFNDFLGTAYVSHAENEVIQLFVDFGIPVAAVVILLSLGLIWRRFVVERGSSYYAEAICGLAAVALGNLADFSIRIPGVLLPTALAAGAVGGQFARTWSKTSGWRMTLASVKVLPVAATAFLLVIVGSGFARESNQDSALALARALPAVPAEVGSDVADATSLRLVALHPHDAYLYTFLGNNRLHAGDLETARRLYLHALELHPLCIPPKVGLARYYLKTGNPAAMLDETLELLVELPKHRVPLFAAVDEAGIAESLIVESWQAEEDVLQDYAKYLGYVRKPAKQERFLKAAIAKIGWDLDLLDRLGSLYLSQLRLEDADLTATYIMALFPERQEGFLLQARVFMYGTRTEEALVMYDEALSKPGPGTVEIGLEMLNVLARTRNWDRFEALAVELRVQVRKDRQQTARFHVIMALREEMFNRDYLALWQLDQAEASDPYDTSVIIKKAEVQRRLGRVDKAAAEYRKALKIDPKHTGAMEGLRSLETGESPPTT
jgi:tetratricopeptide (TPR) repeat protein